MDSQSGNAVDLEEAPHESYSSDTPAKDTTQALRVKKILLSVLLVVFFIEQYAIVHELIGHFIPSEVPPELVVYGADAGMRRGHIGTAIRALPNQAVKFTLMFAFDFCIIYFGVLSSIWKRLAIKYTGSFKPTLQAIIFMGVWYGLLEVYDTLGAKPASYMTDPILWKCLQAFIYGAFMGFLFHRLAKNTRPAVAYSCMAAWCILSIVLQRVQIFYRELFTLTRIPHIPQAMPILEMAKQEGMSTSRIFIQNLRNSHYFGIMFDEMIVLGKDLLLTAPKLLYGVAAHELGHRAHKHFVASMLYELGFRLLGPTIALFGVLNNPTLYGAFGFPSVEPIVAALPIAEVVSLVAQKILNPLKLWGSRTREYEADAFAVKKGYFTALATYHALLSSMRWDQSWLYEKLFSTHPSALNRVLATLEVNKQKRA